MTDSSCRYTRERIAGETEDVGNVDVVEEETRQAPPPPFLSSDNKKSFTTRRRTSRRSLREKNKNSTDKKDSSCLPVSSRISLLSSTNVSLTP